MSETTVIVEPGKQEIVITRIFDAPRDAVFKAYSDPKSIPLWWGPKILTTTVDRMEMKSGGFWRFVQRDPDGNEYAFHGVYHDVLAPELVIYTSEFESMRGHVTLETVFFDDIGGKTKMTDKVVFQSVQDRDGMLKSGMEAGVRESNDRFAELLKTISH